LSQRLPLIRDQDFLARLKPLDQFRQMGLGLFQRESRHFTAPLLPNVKEIGLDSFRRFLWPTRLWEIAMGNGNRG